MAINKLMEEYQFEIDDIRWYCSSVMAERLLNMKETPEELAEFIRSGKLETELYNMEEKFLGSLEEQLSREITDESHVREIFEEIDSKKQERNA